MARKLAKKAASTSTALRKGRAAKVAAAASGKPPKKQRGKKATRVAFRVIEHDRRTRALIDVNVDDPLWVDAEDADLLHAYPDAKGAIVWVTPPLDASEAAVERVVRALQNDGAAVIKLMPRPAGGPVVPAQAHADAAEAPEDQTMRELVMEMADEVNSADPKALKGLLNDVLGEEGL